MVRDFLIVGVSGFVGSMVRYGFYLWFAGRNLISFPWATLAVNIIGCFIIGWLSESISPAQRQIFLACAVGFTGAFTTFSAFGLETMNLFKNGQALLACLNVAANLALGFAAIWLGRTLAY